MNRRDESIRLLAHSIERYAENRAFDLQMANNGLTVMVRPSRDFMAEATSLYEREMDEMVMDRCNAVLAKAHGGSK